MDLREDFGEHGGELTFVPDVGENDVGGHFNRRGSGR